MATTFFSSRELAIAIWLLLFSGWAVSHADVRESIVGVARAALTWRLVVPFILMAAYTLGAVVCLSRLGLWGTDLLKDTILWFVFSGVSLAFSGARIDDVAPLWRRALGDQLKIVIVVEYVVSTYTFSLLAELVLVAVLAIAAAFNAVASLDAKNAPVAKATSILSVVIGVGVAGSAFQQLWADLPKLDPMTVFRNVVLGPVLAVLFIPCIYLLLLVSAYEQLFVRLKLGANKTPELQSYARRAFIRHFGLRARKVQWFARARSAGVMSLRTKSDVDRLLDEAAGVSLKANDL